MDDCVFCKIIAGKIPAQKVYEDNKVFAFLDIAPVSAGHTLVVPRAHHVDSLDTPDALFAELATCAKTLAAAVMKAVKADGFVLSCNTKAAAGQSVFHTHVHIIPRFTDDGLPMWPHQKPSADELQKVAAAIKSHL